MSEDKLLTAGGRVVPLSVDQIDGVGNCITADLGRNYRTGAPEIDLEIDNPWAGDTETGFGRTCRVSLDREQAEQLRDWLTVALMNWDANAR